MEQNIVFLGFSLIIAALLAIGTKKRLTTCHPGLSLCASEMECKFSLQCHYGSLLMGDALRLWDGWGSPFWHGWTTINAYESRKGREHQTPIQNGKRPLASFCKRTDYRVTGEYRKGFDASKLLLKSSAHMHRLKQSISAKPSYYRPKGYHKFSCS